MAASLANLFRIISPKTTKDLIPFCVDGRTLSPLATTTICWRQFNSNRTSITRIRRKTYTCMYPTLLVQPDGSTLRIRYNLPQKIIRFPIDTSSMTAEQLKVHNYRHKKKEKVVIEEDDEDDFDIQKYSHLWHKK